MGRRSATVTEGLQIVQALRDGYHLEQLLTRFPKISKGHLGLYADAFAAGGGSNGTGTLVDTSAPVLPAAAPSRPAPGTAASFLGSLQDADRAEDYLQVMRERDRRVLGVINPPYTLARVLERWGSGTYRLQAMKGTTVVGTQVVELGDTETLPAPASSPLLPSVPAVSDPSASALTAAVQLMSQTTSTMLQTMTSLLAAQKPPDIVALAGLLQGSGGAEKALDTYVEAHSKGLDLGRKLTDVGEGGIAGTIRAVAEGVQVLGALRPPPGPPVAPAAPSPVIPPTGPLTALGGPGVLASSSPGPPPGVSSPPAAGTPAATWDPMRHVCSAISYGLETNDEPAQAAAVARQHLPQDILAHLNASPVERAVEWLMAQSQAIPALSSSSIDNKVEWVSQFVLELRGQGGAGEAVEEFDPDQVEELDPDQVEELDPDAAPDLDLDSAVDMADPAAPVP